MGTTFDIPTPIQMACAKSTSRSQIDGFVVMPHKDGCVAAATDSRCGVWVPGERKGPPVSAIVPGKLRTAKGTDPIEIGKRDGGNPPSVSTTNRKGQTTTQPAGEGVFPPLGDVAPAAKGRVWVSINAELLVKMQAAMGAGGVTLGIDPNNAGAPIAVLGTANGGGDNRGAGVLMPNMLSESMRTAVKPGRYRANADALATKYDARAKMLKDAEAESRELTRTQGSANVVGQTSAA